MYRPFCLVASVLLLLGLECHECVADVILYRIPRTRLQITLQGTATVNPGGTVTVTHPQFGSLYCRLEDTEIFRVPTTAQQFAIRLRKSEGDAGRLMESARWALRHGLIRSSYEATAKALAVDANNSDAQRVRDLKRLIDRPLTDATPQADEMKKLVGRADMEVAESKHFVMLHDTGSERHGRKRLTRAEQRLELLETVYEAFLLRFYANGIELEVPQEKLKVVLFKEHKDYLHFATRLSPDLKSAAGFFDGDTNTSVFYDQGSTEDFQALYELNKILAKAKEDAKKDRSPNAADIVRLADTLALLVEIERESLDIEVVSHEATHQMAANTGLFPRLVLVPTWVHEGLATYFETPNDASWSGIGAVNQQRLERYRVLERDRVHSNIDFIVGDQIFDFAGSLGETLHGYGQAWALTHFLMERHFAELMQFYQRLGQMPPEVVINQKVLQRLFWEVFGDNKDGLDAEWRAYMRALKTDLEEVIGE
ncbi:MAG: DUF1570 domain-containing protein [Planctomycetales bacterium]|nr:DUF1570 domain-containing protein [Planctomycetales bacterium]